MSVDPEIRRSHRARLARLEPWWPPEPDAARRRAQRRADRARRRRLRAARLLRLRHRHARTSTASRPTACASRTSTPPRSCSPTRSCLLTGRNHHSQRHGPRRRPRDRATPATAAASRARTASSPRSCAAHGLRDVRGRQVAPHARRRDAHGRRRAAAGRSGAASSAGTGSTAARPTSSCPTLFHDNHSVQPPRTPDDGYHLSEDLADRAIEYLADLRAVDAEQPFFLYFATGACHSPHHAPPEWIERYRGQFDEGWDAWRERDVRPPARARASCPPGTELSPRPHWVPGVGRPRSPRTRRSRRASWSASPAFLSHTDAQIGRVLDVPRARPASSTTR